MSRRASPAATGIRLSSRAASGGGGSGGPRPAAAAARAAGDRAQDEVVRERARGRSPSTWRLSPAPDGATETEAGRRGRAGP